VLGTARRSALGYEHSLWEPAIRDFLTDLTNPEVTP
jgi:hypothetical protein